MLFDLSVWVLAAMLALPVAGISWSWVRARSYCANGVANARRMLYWATLACATIGALVYVAFWAWRVAAIYDVEVPIRAALLLQRTMYLGIASSALAAVFVFFGIGPNRVTIAFSAASIAILLWLRLPILHWA